MEGRERRRRRPGKGLTPVAHRRHPSLDAFTRVVIGLQYREVVAASVAAAAARLEGGERGDGGRVVVAVHGGARGQAVHVIAHHVTLGADANEFVEGGGHLRRRRRASEDVRSELR